MITRAEADELVEAIHGATVEILAKRVSGVLVLEFWHRGTDEDAKRVAVSLSHVVVDDWPWTQ